MGPLLIWLVLASLSSAARAIEQWECEDNAEIRSGEVVLSNNVWNRGSTKDYEQCVAVQGGSDAFLWRWRWPGGDLMPDAFPEIVFGWQPWHRESTSNALPRRLRGLRRLEAHYDASVTAEGVYNLAFQLWFVASEVVKPAAVRAEVMVWIANEGMSPAGAQIETPAGAAGFDLYLAERRHIDRGVERTWRILTLVARRPRPSGSIDLGSLLRALSAAGHLDRELWLANVDLGTEIAAGSGQAAIRGYRIEIE